MRESYTFESTVKGRGKFRADWEESVVKNEPMLFNCTLPAAYDMGGPITKAFIDAMPDQWRYNKNAIVDSRVHMLMPGWYPCIPGFHHDDVPRRTPSSQPDYDNMLYHSEHLMGLVNGDICPTLFALGTHTLPRVYEGVIYEKWHDIVQSQIDSGILLPYEAPSGVLLEFNWMSMHTGQRAKAAGWRWFIRVSRNTTRVPSNEVRKQVQVYLDKVTAGW